MADVRRAVRSELERFGITTSTGDIRIFETVDEALAAFRAGTGGR